MFWVVLFFLAFCAFIGYSGASIEAITGFMIVSFALATVVSFGLFLLSRA